MKNNKSVAKVLLRKYLTTSLMVVMIGVAVPLALKLILGSRTWYDTDAFYPFLSWANDNLFLLMFVFVTLVFILITAIFIRQAVGLLNQTAGAAQQLVENPRETIELSPELTEIANQLNRVREESLENIRAAKDAEQRKNDLIVYLAHDLRTPLTSIIGYLTLLQEAPDLPMDQRLKYVDITVDKAYRLETLINEFFEITRFNLSKISLIKETTDLSMMVEQILFEYLPSLREKGLTFETAIEPGIKVALDTDKFERVLDNLIRNALSYATPESAIKVSLASQGKHAHLTFENSGPTIPEDKLARIFEPFFRADSARGTVSGGTGLGLSIAKEILELHGGSIQAKSGEQRFIITAILPIS